MLNKMLTKIQIYQMSLEFRKKILENKEYPTIAFSKSVSFSLFLRFWYMYGNFTKSKICSKVFTNFRICSDDRCVIGSENNLKIGIGNLKSKLKFLGKAHQFNYYGLKITAYILYTSTLLFNLFFQFLPKFSKYF